MVQIPFNRPIPLHTFTKVARGNEDRQTEDVVLTETVDHRICIQSIDRTRFLVVLEDGRCEFIDHGAEIVHDFEVVEYRNYVCLRSRSIMRHLLFRDGIRIFHCVHDNADDDATIVFRESSRLGYIFGAAVAGAVMAPAVGLGAAALVPTAMSTFGTVVAGVGTIHAPLAAGGVAAMLQSSSAALLSTSAAVYGAVFGAAVGLRSAANNAADDVAGNDAANEADNDRPM